LTDSTGWTSIKPRLARDSGERVWFRLILLLTPPIGGFKVVLSTYFGSTTTEGWNSEVSPDIDSPPRTHTLSEGTMETPTPIAVCFWFCIAFIVFAYAGYPSILWVLTRFWGRPVQLRSSNAAGLPKSVSVILTAHNEEETIGRRLAEFLDRFVEYGLAGEIIVVSDGSSDGTEAITQSFVDRNGPARVRLISLSTNVGKAAALSVGCAAASSEIIVLADARQTWSADALVRLLENFADPAVGAVSGELKVESQRGVMQGVGLYWRYEKWIRRHESLIHSTVGLTGAICAVRRHLFRPIPRGTLLDDVYWPLCVTMQGYRVVFDDRAHAYDRLPELVTSEFRRKVRTLSGNFQLIARLPAALLPWRNPVWFPFVAHKLARLVVPWAILVALACSATLGGMLYGFLFAGLVAGLTIGVVGLIPAVAARSRLASAAAALVVLNVAAWWAFWVWASGRASRSWIKTTYQPVDPPAELPRAAAPAAPNLRPLGAE
jgi:poly-beta-1,6-N-acetyl-D-glucosamine synthase